MRDLIDLRVPGLGLAPARTTSIVDDAERLAYFADKFDCASNDACIDERGVQSGSRQASPRRAPAGLPAR